MSSIEYVFKNFVQCHWLGSADVVVVGIFVSLCVHGNLLCYQFCSLCFTCVACLLFRLNNKSSQKLVQDRKSPMVRVKYFTFTSSVAVISKLPYFTIYA